MAIDDSHSPSLDSRLQREKTSGEGARDLASVIRGDDDAASDVSASGSRHRPRLSEFDWTSMVSVPSQHLLAV